MIVNFSHHTPLPYKLNTIYLFLTHQVNITDKKLKSNYFYESTSLNADSGTAVWLIRS